MKKHNPCALVLVIISALSFGCDTRQQNDRAKSVANCSSKIGKFSYTNNNTRNCECLFDGLTKAGFSGKEIKWFTEVNTLGYSKLGRANLAQKKIKIYLNTTSLLSSCDIEQMMSDL